MSKNQESFEPESQEEKQNNHPQRVLAYEVTCLVHGGNLLYPDLDL